MASCSSASRSEDLEIVVPRCSMPRDAGCRSDIASLKFSGRLWKLEIEFNVEKSDGKIGVYAIYVTTEPELLEEESADVTFFTSFLPDNKFRFKVGINPRAKYGPFACQYPWPKIQDDCRFTFKIQTKFPANAIPSHPAPNPVSNQPDTLLSWAEFSRNLAQLYENQEMCDAVLKVRGIELRGHKVVLSAASPVFKIMFQNAYNETGTNVVEIIEFESQVISEMLRFIYTREAPQFHSPSVRPRITALYDASCKYNIKHLSILCGYEIYSSANIDSMLDNLKMAVKYNDEDLKQQILNSIRGSPRAFSGEQIFRGFIQQRPEMLDAIVARKFVRK